MRKKKKSTKAKNMIRDHSLQNKSVAEYIAERYGIKDECKQSCDCGRDFSLPDIFNLRKRNVSITEHT